MVTISSGCLKGKKIKIISYRERLRCTTSYVKEALFNLLKDHISGSVILDCFAGSGIIGFEALSRGAHSAVLIEKDRFLARCLRENIRRLGVNARVIQGDCLSRMKNLGRNGLRFDWIYIDPPYTSNLAKGALQACLEYKLLKAGGRIILERGRQNREFLRQGEEGDTICELVSTRRYGTSVLDIYRRVEENERKP